MSLFLQRLPEFLAHHVFLALAFAGLVAAILGNEIARRFRGFKELTPGALTLLITRENPLLVDVSPLADFEKGHIAGARHVPMSQFDAENKVLAKVKDLPVVLTCRTGVTAAGAAKRLVKAGFGKVFVLDGGNAAWQQADL